MNSPSLATNAPASPAATPSHAAPTVAVVVPTFRRVRDLLRCLEALHAQTRPAAQVIVVVRDTDMETQAFLADYPHPVQSVVVAEPGVVAAMSAGITAVRADITAITDDDAAPWPDWLQKIAAHFADNPRIGGVGGRDYLRGVDALEFGAHNTRQPNGVGKVQWFGRVVGDHHLGEGDARPVDLLKGVNGAYRTALLREVGFDRRLWGRGAQVHWELALGYAIKARGYSLLYDPAVGVDHFLGARQDEDQRVYAFHAEAHVNSVHNETLLLLEHMGAAQRLTFLLWALCVGTRHSPGLLQVARLMLKRQPHVWPTFRATQAGRIAGLRSFWKETHQ